MHFSLTAMDYPWAKAVEDRNDRDSPTVTMEDHPQQLADDPDNV